MSTVQVLDQTAAIVPSGIWNVDAAHSQVDFAIRHLAISTIRGTFSEVSAKLLGGEKPTLTGSIRLASVETKDEARDQHLLAPDFFDADRYPEAAFTATFISPEKVVGDFTLKGITRKIELAATFTGPATDPYGHERVGIDLEGELDRTDYGITFNMPLPTGGLALGEKVKLSASLSFVKEA